MKKIQFILFLCLSATLLSCGDDDVPAFTLTSANIAGNYDISSIQTEEKETATSSSGSMVDLSETKGVAKTFDDVAFVLNSNGTYTASGKFVFETTETPSGGTPEVDNEIIVFDASGTYAISATGNTITFNPTTGDFIEGAFKVVTFTQNVVNISQDDIDVDGSITFTSNLTMGLSRQ